MEEQSNSGGDPQTLGQCTACGSVYPVQETADSELRPIGTGGACDCGNADFVHISDE